MTYNDQVEIDKTEYGKQVGTRNTNSFKKLL